MPEIGNMKENGEGTTEKKSSAGKDFKEKSETRLIMEMAEHEKPLLTSDEFAIIKEYTDLRKGTDWETAIHFLTVKLKKSPMRVEGIINSAILKILRDFIKTTEEKQEQKEMKRLAATFPT